MQFVLHISAFNEDPLKVYERMVASGSLDGFVVLDPIADDPRIAFLQTRKVPFVLHGRMGQKPGHPLHDNDAVPPKGSHVVTCSLQEVLLRLWVQSRHRCHGTCRL
jgi:hypothetical protein